MHDPVRQAISAWEHLKAGKPERAESIAREILRRHPNDAEGNNLMAVLSRGAGKTAQAVYYARAAVKAAPANAQYRSNLGALLCADGKPGEGLAELARAVELAPEGASARSNYAVALMDAHRYGEALAQAREAARLAPGEPTPAKVLSQALLHLGEGDEAARVLRDAARASAAPSIDVLTALAYALNYSPAVTPEELFDAHRRMGLAIQSGAALMPRVPFRAERPLRVGFLSPDLRDHSVARFVLPLLRHLDRAAFEAHLYYTGPREDDYTKRLRAHARTFHALLGQPSEAIARRIRADRIDILIDLAGNTSRDNLMVLARRPAPLQATYCGYPGTTGLGATDLRFVDSHTDPPAAPPAATETLVRLDPCFLCFEPPAEAPPVAPPPSAAEGFITFGSFNALMKMNEPLVAAWARVLRAVPGSRLLLKNAGLSDEAARARWAKQFEDTGIDPARLDLLAWIDAPGGHLGAYARIDVALDTFPYHGTTTTCEALFMGVPVVTRAGDRHASRVGVSLLHAAGLPELIARDEAEFVDLAAALAADPPRLAALRAGLRERLISSPLMNAPAFGARFSAALSAAWDEAAARA